MQALFAFVGLFIVIIPIPIAAIVMGHRRELRALEMRHSERMAAMDKGMPIPADPPPPPPKPSSPLLRGLIWLGVGLAIVFCGFDFRLGRIGWIPAAVGAAYLIWYLIEARRAGGNLSAPPPN